jgi:disintegrin and metalloproteinase domain-containing protein 10
LLCLLQLGVEANQLVTKYQPLSVHDIQQVQSRGHGKRSTDAPLYHNNNLEDIIMLQANLDNKHYTLMLTRVVPAVSDVTHFTVNQGRRVDVDRVYAGHVQFLPDSSVLGFLNSQGLFEGRVTLGNTTHMIESHHIVSEGDVAYDVHKYPTVAFTQHDLSPQASQGFCGVTGASKTYSLPDFSRGRRSEAAPPKNTCKLLVVADHLFTQAYGDDIDAVATMLTYVVTEADNIFRETIFGDAKGFGMQIASMLIYTGEDVDNPNYPFYGQPSNVGSTVFLNSLSEWTRSSDRSGRANGDFCLVFAFTNRDFKGVLGEAYTSQTCSAYNSGVITVNLSGARRPRLMTALTFTHEAGHSFGSPHDESRDCSPGNPHGNFLMHWQAQDGTRSNNVLFSPCSRAAISDNLGAIAAGSRNCLASQAAQTCGNRVVEGSEDCDCGFEGQCDDRCCNAATTDAVNVNGCRLAGQSQCSPSGSECCDRDSCTPSRGGAPCGEGLECAVPRTCIAGQAKCPDAVHLGDGDLCLNGTKTCFEGNCVGSLCHHVPGHAPCSCTPAQLGDKATENCVICCQEPGGECQPIQDVDGQWWEEQFASPGDLCTNNDGFCDEYHICRRFGEEGFILSMMKKLFSKDQWSDFASQYWWVLVLLVVALVVVVGLFVHLFAVYTPTQNPKLKDKKYRGPKHYLSKQVNTYQEKRRDQVDSGKPALSATERRHKTLNRFKQKRRVVMANAPTCQPESEL